MSANVSHTRLESITDVKERAKKQYLLRFDGEDEKLGGLEHKRGSDEVHIFALFGCELLSSAFYFISREGMWDWEAYQALVSVSWASDSDQLRSTGDNCGEPMSTHLDPQDPVTGNCQLWRDGIVWVSTGMWREP